MLIKNNKVYDYLKWIDLVILPALGTAYAGLSQIWALPYAEEVPATIMVICTLIGSILGISNASYYRAEMNSTGAFMEMYEDFANGVLEDSKGDEE